MLTMLTCQSSSTKVFKVAYNFTFFQGPRFRYGVKDIDKDVLSRVWFAGKNGRGRVSKNKHPIFQLSRIP